MSTPWIDTTLWSCAAALQHGFALSWIFPLWIMSQCSFPSSFTHAVESEFTLFRSQRCIHTHCLIVPLHNALLTQRTVYHSWAQSSCTDPVDIWLIVPTENLSEFPAVSQKAKGKCYLLQSRGGPSAHTAAGYQWASEEMNVSIFQSTLIFCIQFTWGQTELQMLDCRTCQRTPPPPTPIWPSDTVTTGNTSGTDLTATQEVCVGAHSGDKDRTGSRGCRERSRVTLYWIIWINNRAGCGGSRFH